MEEGISKWIVPWWEVMIHHPLFVTRHFKMKIDLNKENLGTILWTWQRTKKE